MKLKKVAFSFALIASLFMGNTTVFAQDVVVTTKTATGSALSTFDVDANVIGGGVVVSIPSTLDPVYNAESKQFVCKDVISAKGLIGAEESLSVTVATEVIYTHNTQADVVVTGVVTFGEGGTETWSADEMSASMENLDTRPITVTVKTDDLKFIGSYSTEMFFDITIQ